MASLPAQCLGAGQLEDEDSLNEDAEPPDIVRVFFGLPVPAGHRKELGRYLEQCSSAAPQFRWVAEDNLHLTLRFLGRVEHGMAVRVAQEVTDQHPSAFEVELGELGTFKRGRAARVVWMGLRSGAAAARELAALVEGECVKAGLEAEPRPLEPHLTLARARSQLGAVLPALPPLPHLDPWTAGELILYRSHLQRAGAVYEPLVRVGLAG
jgi:RNA 2',3'-cyclic 3'-phosphodiesterase